MSYILLAVAFLAGMSAGISIWWFVDSIEPDLDLLDSEPYPDVKPITPEPERVAISIVSWGKK